MQSSEGIIDHLVLLPHLYRQLHGLPYSYHRRSVLLSCRRHQLHGLPHWRRCNSGLG